jgi:hypothetical protein
VTSLNTSLTTSLSLCNATVTAAACYGKQQRHRPVLRHKRAAVQKSQFGAPLQVVTASQA